MKNIFLLFFISTALLSCAKKNPRVVIRTELGDITVELYPEKAPVTVANFLRYVKENRFQGATLYRTVTMDNQPDNDTKIEVIQGAACMKTTIRRRCLLSPTRPQKKRVSCIRTA